MYLRCTAYAQPSFWVDAEQIEKWTNSKPGFISTKIGNQRRAFLAEGETGLDIAERACTGLFEKIGKAPAWDLLIVVTQTPDYKLPHMSALLQDRCGLSHTTASFDLALGCSGFVYALKVAEGFLTATGGRNALIVTCDPYSRIMAPEDRNTVTVFGDAAAAAWVSLDEGPGAGRIGQGVFGTDGAGAEHLIIRNGGARHPLTPTVSGPAPADPKDEGSRLYMSGRAILEFMMTRIPPILEECLDKNGLTRDEVDFFVLHQASKYMLRQITRHMELPPEKVPVYLDDVANTVSSSIPIAITQLSNEQALDRRTLLLCGFGVGLSWGAVTIRY